MSAGTPGAPPPPQPPPDPQRPAGAGPGDPGHHPVHQDRQAPYGPPSPARRGPAPDTPGHPNQPPVHGPQAPNHADGARERDAYGQAAPQHAQAAQPGHPGQSGSATAYGAQGRDAYGQGGLGGAAGSAGAYGPQVADGRATASGRAAVAGAFAPPPGMSWARVSPRLAWYRRIQVLGAAVVVMVVGVFLAARFLGLPGGIAVLVAVLACAAVAWLLVEYNARSWGYVEQADEFLMTHGVLVRRFVVIPYGRMQLVDVNSNVVQQWFGIATVRLYTAAATTDARLPGIPPQEAERLRDRLVAKSEARSMGL